MKSVGKLQCSTEEKGDRVIERLKKIKGLKKPKFSCRNFERVQTLLSSCKIKEIR